MNGPFRPGFRGERPSRNAGPPDQHRINRKIIAPEVRLIGEAGEQLGVMATRQALQLAEESGLDLVEVAANSSPPVCRLMDYGKFKYREQKKEAEARKKHKETELKELRIRYATDEGDLDVKLRKAKEFLEAGDKVKFSMRFRGREIMYTDLGKQKFDEIIERLKEVAHIDERSPVGGRQMHITLAPNAKK